MARRSLPADPHDDHRRRTGSCVLAPAPGCARPAGLPAIGEVVFVEEALAGSKAEIGQPDPSGVIAEAEAAGVGDAVLAPVDDEAREMLVAPAQGELKEPAKLAGVLAAATCVGISSPGNWWLSRSW
jgi:hypothetical protein